MALLRETEGFPGVFGIAARDLPDPTAFIEKDYWVTQILRALNVSAPGGFVLRGGTSLSKGYRIINRFSEDVDILLVPHAGESGRGTEDRLRLMTEQVAATLGLTWEPARRPGRGGHPSRGDFIRYPGSQSAGFRVASNLDAVLVETRVGDGDEPSEMAEMTTLIGSWKGIDVREYADLDPFVIRVLEPRRTFIEKLVAVHHAMSTWTPERPPNQKRFGRHYYDIYCLLAHRPTLDRLADRVRFGHLLNEIERISDRYYGGHTTRPNEGFAGSIAFVPPRGTELRTWLEESYRVSLELLSHSEKQPPFGQVLRRVAECKDLL